LIFAGGDWGKPTPSRAGSAGRRQVGVKRNEGSTARVEEGGTKIEVIADLDVMFSCQELSPRTCSGSENYVL